MSTQLDSNVLPVQCMIAWARPARWEDALIVGVVGETVTVATLDGATKQLRVVGTTVELGAGEPVAYHPVAELLHAGGRQVTARAV